MLAGMEILDIQRQLRALKAGGNVVSSGVASSIVAWFPPHGLGA
jgi:hypothetical protein